MTLNALCNVVLICVLFSCLTSEGSADEVALPQGSDLVSANPEVTTEAFAREVERTLPQEHPYEYHKRLSEDPVHVPRRNPATCPSAGDRVFPVVVYEFC